MILFDQHTHSRCSPDSDAPLRDMAEAARDHGMSLICFTDHFDMDDDRTGHCAPTWPERWPDVVREMEALLADPPAGIEIRWGMELGEIHHDPATAAKAAAAPELDFVLGSLHNLRDTPDFYHIRYSSLEECETYNRAYLRELAELAEQECFDSMAHMGYTSRYMIRRGFRAEITADRYRDELAEIFRRLIRSGKGVEVNTSGLREGQSTFPDPSALSLYRDLGGEIVTVGSDAHTPRDAGIGVKEAYQLLQSLGFRYVARFTKRKPDFVRIDG